MSRGLEPFCMRAVRSTVSPAVHADWLRLKEAIYGCIVVVVVVDVVVDVVVVEVVVEVVVVVGWVVVVDEVVDVVVVEVVVVEAV